MIQTQIGVGVLGLPYNVHLDAKGNSWICIVITGLMIQMVLCLYWGLGKKFSHYNLYGYTPVLFGKFIGGAVNMLYVLYGITVMAVILIFAVGIIKDWVLDETPRWILLALLCLTGIYLGKEKAGVIAKFNVIVSSLIVLLLVITLIALYTYPLEFRYLLPITQTGVMEIAKGVTKVYFSMIGFEILLILYPYIKAKKTGSILKAATAANIAVTGIYAYLTIVCDIVFSPKEIELIPQPILYLVKALYIQVIERFDLLFVSIWIVNVLTSYVGYMFLSAEGTAAVAPRLKRSVTVPVISAVTFCIALFISTDQEAQVLNDYLLIATVFFVLVIPVLLYFTSFFRKKESVR